jgi:ubiquinone/menaquinone biosynthesis C-methylase UbiE
MSTAPSSSANAAALGGVIGHNNPQLDQVDVGTLPQPWDTIGRHAALPTLKHDDRARLDGLAHLNHFLSQEVVPRMQADFEEIRIPAFEAEKGRAPESRDEARAALENGLLYPVWSRLRRGAMEQRQKFLMDALVEQGEAHAEACSALSNAAGNLELNPDLDMPEYLTEVHAHLMPGGYVTDRVDGDVSAGASYEAGLYSTVPGRSGPNSDGAGRALSAWLKETFPEMLPKRIFDLGCGAGLNTVAVAKAFPDAEILAFDAGAPMLRYAAARAAAMGVTNIRFIQANIEDLPEGIGEADVVYTAIVLHETSYDALRAIFRTAREHTASGGVTLHVEQPAYDGKPLFEQVLRDWDGRYNNEAFWSQLYQLDLHQEMTYAGFADEDVFTDSISAVPWTTDAKTKGKFEDYGRTGNWTVIGGKK